MKINLYQNITETIDKTVEDNSTSQVRNYLGASLIGHECDRYLWWNFRNAIKEAHSGRMLRLFARGQREEEVFCALLENIGCELENVLDNQLSLPIAPFIGGHPDGVIAKGLVGYEASKLLLEFKTHNAKSFKELASLGVEKAKPQHYAQMQSCMYGAVKLSNPTNKDYKRCLYLAVNKDNDELYAEIVEYDEAKAKALISRATDIVLSQELPQGLSNDPSFYKCAWCPCKDLCFGSKTIDPALLSCKHCAYAMPQNNSWFCNKWGKDIPSNALSNPCDFHILNPAFVGFETWETPDESIGYIVNGEMVKNGVVADGWSSKKLLDPKTQALLKVNSTFEGAIVRE